MAPSRGGRDAARTEDWSDNNPAVTVPASHALYYRTNSGHEEPELADPNEPDTSDGSVIASKTKSSSALTMTKNDVGWRRIVRNFSPSWFSVTMGTGIVSILLSEIPFHARWLHYLSIVFFVLNAILWCTAFAISVLRYTLYPAIWTVMIQDPNNSLFLGTIPMGFATLIQMWLIICVPVWGPWAVTFAWILWMIDSIAAAAVTFFLSFSLMSNNTLTSLDRITAAQLLPIAATIVAAGAGARVADALPNPQHALGTLLTCYVEWGMSVPLALTVIVMYYQRLAVHKLPSREIIVSCFLPLGPLGFGGFGILYMGKTALTVFPATDTLPAAQGFAAPAFYIVGFLTALLFWGFGLVWLVLALGSIWRSRPFPFNMGWWGFTFPLGVFAASTIQIGEELPSVVFKAFGTVFAVAVILLWCVVAAGTARGAWMGTLFFAPCVANLDKRVRDERKRMSEAGVGGTEKEVEGDAPGMV